MRLVLPALAALAIAGTAQAGSIESVKDLPKPASADSIVVVGCGDCPPPAPKKSAYLVPALKVGEQTVEIKTVNGEQKIYRTDAWIGGSPVTYVSTPTKEEIAAIENPVPEKTAARGDGIDKTATTAAVGAIDSGAAPAPLAIAPAKPVVADMAAPDAPEKIVPLDTTSFTIRTN